MRCWSAPSQFKSFPKIIEDRGRDAIVYVKIPPKILEECEPLTRQTLQGLMKTNIVCTAQASGVFPIEQIPWPLGGTFLRPVFPSCIGKNHNPSGSWTGFRQGYYRCAGTNRREKAQLLFYHIFFRLFMELRIQVKMYNFSVQNIVTATSVPYMVNQEKFSRFDPLLVKFEPDWFPGAIHRGTFEGAITSQVFDSGKINAVGARNEMEPIKTILHLEPVLRKCRIYEYKVSFPCKMTPEEMFLFHENAVKRHSQEILKFERVYRKNKKLDKIHKDFSKKRKCETRALQQGEMELERARKRRKHYSFFMDLGLDAAFLQHNPTDNKKSVIQKRLACLPPEEVHDDSVYIYRVDSSSGGGRTYEVEVLFDGTVFVLDADNEQEALLALEQISSILKLGPQAPVLSMRF
jgi:TATA-box binding protein (TBP) (component of TFIID and TFIIIB)